MRIIHCQKLDKSAEGLEAPPMPGELGQKVYECISKEAWLLWLAQQTIFINENRLSMADPTARGAVIAELNRFLFSSNEAR